MLPMSNRYGRDEGILDGAAHYRAIGTTVLSFCVFTEGGKRTITVMAMGRNNCEENIVRHVLTRTYHTTQIKPKKSTGNGDLDGFKIVCTCGDVQTSSLPEQSQSLAIDHKGWHRRRGE